MPLPRYFDFLLNYNPALKAYEVEAVELPFYVYGKNEEVDGPYAVPRLLTETATTVTVEQKCNGMGDTGFKARRFWKTPEAAWEAAVKLFPDRKLLTLAETVKAVKNREAAKKAKRLAELRKELANLEK
jgi:hypothetical protein